jgi:tRNA uridine 5-carboxymethylaminomethyl modification enzyme
MKQKEYFSFETKSIKNKHVNCYLTHTNKKTHKVILNNLDRSPLYEGMIDGIGPRYCPSIEDKVVRFRDKDQHQIFIEPEGYDTTELYLQGMNTSLPYDVQLQMLRTMRGLENVEIRKPGYAIAYDFIYSEQLERTLKIKHLVGVYSAGQLNGTSGYEEAAGQGLLAGINAALFVQGKEPLILTREDSYIGTLIDDLITKEIREPYRMMTSRSEYRLYLRQDNADTRLLEKGYQAGLVSKLKYTEFQKREKRIAEEKAELEKQTLKPNKAIREKLKKFKEQLTKPASFYSMLKRSALDFNALLELGYRPKHQLTTLEKDKLAIQVRYADYIAKVKEQIAHAEKHEHLKLGKSFDYTKLYGLRNEAREKLTRLKPETLGQAARIAGVNPADISVLLLYLETYRKGTTTGKQQRKKA